MYMGFYYAPHTVAQALKTAVFCAAVYEQLGFSVSPGCGERRADLIQTVNFGDERKLLAFCAGIQAGSAVDSHVRPEPWDMPGYAHKVVMASGSFVAGSSVEISADAPIKPPYTAFLQGGLTYETGKYAILASVQALVDEQLIDLT